MYCYPMVKKFHNTCSLCLAASIEYRRVTDGHLGTVESALCTASQSKIHDVGRHLEFQKKMSVSLRCAGNSRLVMPSVKLNNQQPSISGCRLGGSGACLTTPRFTFLSHFYRAMHMHKRGICCHPVSACLSVCHVPELRQNE